MLATSALFYGFARNCTLNLNIESGCRDICVYFGQWIIAEFLGRLGGYLLINPEFLREQVFNAQYMGPRGFRTSRAVLHIRQVPSPSVEEWRSAPNVSVSHY